MKKLIYLLAVAAFMISCNQQSAPGYRINGHVSGLDTGRVFIDYRVNGRWTHYDSAIVENGEFAIEGSVSIPELYYLRFEGHRAAKGIFLENADMEFTGNIDSIGFFNVTGSSINEEYFALDGSLRAYYMELLGISNKARAAGAEGNMEMEAKYSAQADSVYGLYISTQKDFIENHPDSYITPQLLSQNSNSMSGAEINEAINKLDPKLHETDAIKKLKERAALLMSVAIGQPAPDFTQADTAGNEVSLSSFRGKYVLLDFWAAWCGPCRGENPNVVAAWEKYNKDGFDVLGVSMDDDKEKWLQAVADDNLTWTQLSELVGWKNSAGKLYGVNAIPSNFLIDREGIIVGRNVRGQALQDSLAVIFGY